MIESYALGGAAGTPGHRRPAATGADPEMAVAEALRAGRRDPTAVILEGAHALKHALRFGAEVELIATPDASALADLLLALAPDVAEAVGRRTVTLGPAAWDRAVGRALPSPALSRAARPVVSPADVLDAPGVVVALEQPRHLGNLGAVVRVTAAAGAGGVLVIGDADPWHPIAVRGAAGLQFALPVARADALPATARRTVALDGAAAGGGPLRLDGDDVLLVGTERGGLSPELRDRADVTVGIPMRAGVSSLNLATAVAIALYAGR